MDGDIWNVINVIAPHLRQGRCQLWEELTNFLLHSRNSFCMGNFSSPLYPSEKFRGVMHFIDSMNDLENFINTNYLIDLKLRGVYLKWSNDRKWGTSYKSNLIDSLS